MGNCIFCQHWHKETINADKEADCDLNNIKTTALKTCPGWQAIERTAEQVAKDKAEVDRLMSLGKTASQPQPKQQRAPVKRVSRTAVSTIVYPDDSIKQVELFNHQKVAFEKFKDADEIALFFEMGCGKTITCLSIAWYKYKHGMIKGLLVVAPNDVHKQWYDDIVNPNPDAGKVFDEAIQVQCVGGRGGQKELYPFESDDMFKFVSVNVDTFSQPHKWEDIVEWANYNNYMIAIDEATVIKNPDSKRSQRLLYEFNDVVKRGKRIVSSTKKHPVRAVLTGTPVTNGPMDLWSIMEFVKPNYFLRNYYSFKAYFGMFTRLTVETAGMMHDIDVLLTEKTWQGIHDMDTYDEARCVFGCTEDTYMTIKHQDKFLGPYKHADELKQLLEPVSVFAKLVDCVDMPAVHYVERRVELSPEQQSVYNNMKRDLIAQYDGYNTTAKNKLIVNLRLQQISSGFIMGQKDMTEADWNMFTDNPEALENFDILPNEVVWIGKTNPKLDALMRDIAECDKPLLILTRYTAEAAKIYELCKDKYRTGLFTGWKVEGGIDAFKNGDLDILVANSSKISRGFNLQNAHTTLFYSNTFSMETRQQSEFRTFRIGQKHPCQYIDYISCPVDETIINSLKLKKNLLDYIREKDIEETV